MVGADPGRLRRAAALLARGEGDGPMTVAAMVDGSAGAGRRGRRREASCGHRGSRRRCRAPAPAKAAAAPLADAAAGDRTRGGRRGGGARTDGRRCADPRTTCCRTWRSGSRSAAWRRRCCPIRWPGRCSSSVTADVDVTDDEVRGLRARNPSRFASTADIAEHLRGAARRRAFRLWLDARCADARRARAGLRASRRSASARQHPQALMADHTLAIDIGGTKIAVGLVDDDGALAHHAEAADAGR